MLREIIKYFAENNTLSARDIAYHFGLETEVVEGMLEILLRKNKIRLVKFDCKSCANSCSSCEARAFDYYEKIKE